MGMDVSGLNPKINKSIGDFPTLEKWDAIPWGERNKDEWEKVQEDYWKEYEQFNKANVGIYFRNNCWWWRPLWDFCAYHCPELISEETHKSGHYNDGAGLNAEDAAKLGLKLLVLIEDGIASEHQKEIELTEESDDYHYPFSVENVEKFANFCIQSGGFEIW